MEPTIPRGDSKNLLRPKVSARLGDGSTLEGGSVTGLGELTVAGQSPGFDLGRARSISIEAPAEFRTSAGSIVARRVGRDVGRRDIRIDQEYRVSTCLEPVRRGRFIVGDYPDAVGKDVEGERPELNYQSGREANPVVDGDPITGDFWHFVVGRLGVKDGQVTRLAVDFQGRRERRDSVVQVRPLWVMIRHNSTFRRAIRRVGGPTRPPCPFRRRPSRAPRGRTWAWAW